jgi:hypothetical protein
MSQANESSNTFQADGGSISRQSETFHEGYGDFAIKSSDGVIFHMPSFLLSYMSPVFKDMFALGPPRGNHDQTQPQQEPVCLTEDSKTLDLLFRHIDPKQTPQPLDEHTIPNLLEAANKYQVSFVMTWFDKEARASKQIRQDAQISPVDALISSNPTLVLSLASRYGLSSLAREALLIRLGGLPIEDEELILGLELYNLTRRLRRERLKLFMETIRKIADHRPEREETQYLSGSFKRSTNQIKEPGPLKCSQCDYQRSSWIMSLVEAVQKGPTWESFSAVAKTPNPKCLTTNSECKGWFKYVSYIINPFESQIKAKESELPVIPFMA